MAPVGRLDVRPGIGAAARIVQARALDIARIHIGQPALILVGSGRKSVRCAEGRPIEAGPGEGVVLFAGQTVDFSNAVLDGARYEAAWLLFDHAVVAAHAAVHPQGAPGVDPRVSAKRLATVPAGLHEAFDRASRALACDSRLPDAIVQHRLLEVLEWLGLEGCVFPSKPAPQSTAVRVRALLAGRLERDWSTAELAAELAMSEATLRRRLAAEALTLGDLLVDARMSFALTLLQASVRPIGDIAAAVGYASASRFAVRFRQRFGFAPSAVRGHVRS